MALQIQLSTDFSPTAVNFSKFHKNKNGGKSVYLNNTNGGSLLLQLPYMRAPFGLSSFTDDATKKTSYSLDLSFDNNDAQVVELQQKMLELDEMVLDLVNNNSKEWLGKTFNKAVLKEALYKPLVRPSKGEYASTIKFKVLVDNNTGNFIPESYNSRREQVKLDTLEKGQRLMAIVDFNHIWFIDNKFGVTARLKQCLMEPSKKIPSFAFQGVPPPEDEDDDECHDECVEEGEIDM